LSGKVLEVSNLVVRYGGILVLERVSLDVNENEIVGLAGSNGAGKSTIMNTIAGIKKPESGGIRFLGKNIIDSPARHRRRMGMALVPQEENVFPQMSVEKNLDVAGHFLQANQKPQEMNYVFELFPALKERREQSAGSLSGGEQRMLAIAMGLVAGPSLLLIDEPSIGLAPKLVSKLFNALKTIKSHRSISMLVAEQNIGILDIAERVYGLEGKVVRFEERTERLDEGLVKKLYLGAS
jgi:branched-chain amino acid transport system ATP-binding protein